LEKRAIIATLDLGKGCAALRRHGAEKRRLYVTTELDNSVTVIDPQPESGRTVPTASRNPTCWRSRVMNGGAYTANVAPERFSVSIGSQEMITIIPVAKTHNAVAFVTTVGFSPLIKISRGWRLLIRKPTVSPLDRMPGTAMAARDAGRRWLVIAIPRQPGCGH